MPFCPACRASLSYRRVPSVMPAGCQREARVLLCCCFICVGMGRSHGFPIENVGNDRRGIGMTEGLLDLFVMPAGSPLSCPPGPPITNVGDKVSGKPGSCFVVLFVCMGMGEDLDSRLKMSGMTEGGLKAGGMTEGGIEGVGHDGRPALPVCHALTPPHPGTLPQGAREEDASLSCPDNPSVMRKDVVTHMGVVRRVFLGSL